MELEARKKQQREEEKRKAEEAAAKANHEQTIEGRNQSAGDFVENSQSVGADTDPSISGVVNGNPLVRTWREIRILHLNLALKMRKVLIISMQ
jgi:hypothetical protein